MAKICSIDGCEESVHARDWCQRHYQRWRKHGDPVSSMRRHVGDPDPERITCLHCNVDKPGDLVHFHRHDNGNLRSVCRRCFSKQTYKARKKRGRTDEEYAKDREVARDSNMKKYGIDWATFQTMSVAQGGKCQICGKVPSGKLAHSRLNVDHNHKTGQIRGLLCNRCNVALGQFRDDPALLRCAANYLESEVSGMSDIGKIKEVIEVVPVKQPVKQPVKTG